ncbi:HlyD family secretion protein [Novosphingobium decolorationis]|uniref:HlyD family secretion protein n=1 Tax=Novosphingobium decolorationis TaxID=2698673 RepID=A0ABX8E8W8_9SPHN|nr:HlyD family secretion protein [Novosphingobium decolorationis]MED5544321.1 HlyD family secretion protein [Pseudomonadota bacterium]QVM85635.1 HlyD family secretion protein [Novosphingobium decolorationis]
MSDTLPSAERGARRPWIVGTIIIPGDNDRYVLHPHWPWYAGGFVILAFIAYVLFSLFVPRSEVTTDDARVTAHYAVIAPRVAGQVVSVDVEDNQMVKKGQLLARLDDRDFRVAVDEAQAQLDRDLAQVANAEAALARQPALVAQEQAQVRQASARLDLAEANATRYDNLANSGSGSRQAQQQARATQREQASRVEEARAAVQAATRELAVLRAAREAALSAVKADRARLAQAKLDLGYTRITAPVDGMVGQREAEPGNYVAPGAALMAVVPLEETFVEANYREVALKHVAPGQRVRIHVDAYDIDLDGVVDSVPPATGAAFSPVGPENATGNFTKIVQRLPVKIRFAAGQPEVRHLRMGMSVETRIETHFADVIGGKRQTAYLGAKEAVE